jgi:MFS family permease
MLTIVRRLQIAHLCLGMMFWYGIEQLFLNHVLRDPSARAYVTIAFCVALLAFDIPTGVFADKVGRKAALIACCIVQALAVLTLGLSHSLSAYIIGCVLMGLGISLLNGAAQALLYDTLKEQKLSKSYAKYQGQVYAGYMIGAGIANIASGFIANAFGLRAPYLLSAIPSLLAIVLIAGISEPPRHRATANWFSHLGEAAHEIATRPKIIIFGLQFIVTELAILTIGEFGQAYLLTFGVGTVALGLLWALVAATAAIGEFTAHRGQSHPKLVILGYCAVLGAFIITHSAIGIVLFLVWYGWNLALQTIAEAEVQDATASHIRATLFSGVSFVANLLSVPLLLLYNNLYITRSIFSANRLIGIISIVVLLLTLVAATRTKRPALLPPLPLKP